MVSGGWNWGIDTPSFRHSSPPPSLRCVDKDLAIHLRVAPMSDVGTRSSETTRTKQEHYFNLLLLLISSSAIIQEAELCGSQPPPYEPSITVSASLQSLLALSFFFFPSTCFSLLCFFLQKTPLAEKTAIHPIPQLTVQTYSHV